MNEKMEKEKHSFQGKVRKDFSTFYRFHQIFSPPACRKFHPLFRLYLQKRLS